MSELPKPQHVAVIGDPRGPDAARVEAYLRERAAPEACWYAPGELADLDAAVRAGQIRRVLLLRLEDLLEALWEREIELDRWLALGVELHCVESPPPPPAACLAAVAQSWQRWRRRQRRRQLIGGLVLSVLALVAAFALIWLSSGAGAG